MSKMNVTILLLGYSLTGLWRYRELLSSKYGFKKFDVREELQILLREGSESNLFEEITGIVSRGQLISTDLMEQFLSERAPFEEPRLLLQSYPATAEQAKGLDSLLYRNDRTGMVCIYFETDADSFLELMKPKAAKLELSYDDIEEQYRSESNKVAELVGYYADSERLIRISYDANYEFDELAEQLVISLNL